MQPNYEELLRRQQQDYQRSRNPFEYGRQVAQRRYSEIMANIDAQKAATQQSYSDMFQAARQRAVRGAAMGGPTLSGGMGQQRTDFLSTAEIQATGQIGSARNQAMRDLYTQQQAAFSNAQLEGQQAAQMEVQNRQTAFQLAQQRQAILNDKNLNDEQKQELLGALEGQPGVGASTDIPPRTLGQNVATGMTISGTLGIGTAATAKAFATGARRLAIVTGKKVTAGKLLASGKILGSVGAKGGITKAATAFAATAAKSKGLAAVAIGAKAGAVKLGLAKGALVAGKLALVGIGPVGWGILAVVGIGAAIGIGLSLANK